MSYEALIGLLMLITLLGAIFIGVPISFTLLFLSFKLASRGGWAGCRGALPGPAAAGLPGRASRGARRRNGADG